jgi:hypothetical protein
VEEMALEETRRARNLEQELQALQSKMAAMQQTMQHSSPSAKMHPKTSSANSSPSVQQSQSTLGWGGGTVDGGSAYTSTRDEVMIGSTVPAQLGTLQPVPLVRAPSAVAEGDEDDDDDDDDEELEEKEDEDDDEDGGTEVAEVEAAAESLAKFHAQAAVLQAEMAHEEAQERRRGEEAKERSREFAKQQKQVRNHS